MLPRTLYCIDPANGFAYGYVCNKEDAISLAKWFKKAYKAGVFSGRIVVLEATDIVGFEKACPYIIATSYEYIESVNDPHYKEHKWREIDVSELVPDD